MLKVRKIAIEKLLMFLVFMTVYLVFLMVHILDILELFILICIPPFNKNMYSGSVWSCNCKWRGSPEKLVSDKITCCLFSGVT